MPDTDIVQLLRTMVDEIGLVQTSRRLGVPRDTISNFVAWPDRSRTGTKALFRERLTALSRVPQGI